MKDDALTIIATLTLVLLVAGWLRDLRRRPRRQRDATPYPYPGPYDPTTLN